jgi:AraC-like DNA-binding protein
LFPQYDVIMQVLMTRLARARNIGSATRGLIAAAISNEETLTIRALADRAGLSARRVQTIYRDDVSLSSKQLIRISRLQRVLAIRRRDATLA